MSNRTVVALIAASLVLIALPAPAAMAEGGADIAHATPVTVGQLTSGDLRNMPVLGERRRAWYSIPVTAGDQLTIDWSSDSQDTLFASPQLLLLPVGTTDFTFPSAKAWAHQVVGETLHNQLKFTVPTTGTMPFEINANRVTSIGLYSFTVNVTHAAQPASGRTVTNTTRPVTRATVSWRNGKRISHFITFGQAVSSVSFQLYVNKHLAGQKDFGSFEPGRYFVQWPRLTSTASRSWSHHRVQKITLVVNSDTGNGAVTQVFKDRIP